MRAAGRVVGNLALAERADALGFGRGSFRLLVDLVHRADDEEHAERGQDEVDDVLDEQAVVDRADTGRGGRLGGNVAAAVERDEQAAEQVPQSCVHSSAIFFILSKKHLSVSFLLF